MSDPLVLLRPTVTADPTSSPLVAFISAVVGNGAPIRRLLAADAAAAQLLATGAGLLALDENEFGDRRSATIETLAQQLGDGPLPDSDERLEDAAFYLGLTLGFRLRDGVR